MPMPDAPAVTFTPAPLIREDEDEDEDEDEAEEGDADPVVKDAPAAMTTSPASNTSLPQDTCHRRRPNRDLHRKTGSRSAYGPAAMAAVATVAAVARTKTSTAFRAPRLRLTHWHSHRRHAEVLTAKNGRKLQVPPPTCADESCSWRQLVLHPPLQLQLPPYAAPFDDWHTSNERANVRIWHNTRTTEAS